LSVDTGDEFKIPVILAQTVRGLLICLPDHETAFELKYSEDIDKDSFIDYMDGHSADMVASAVIQALKLISLCGGGLDWL